MRSSSRRILNTCKWGSDQSLMLLPFMPDVVLLRCAECPERCSALGARFNNSVDTIHPCTSVRQSIRHSGTCNLMVQAKQGGFVHLQVSQPVRQQLLSTYIAPVS